MFRAMSMSVSLPREKFLPLMEQCSFVFNAHTKWAVKNKTCNKSKAHYALYATLRDRHPEIPSAMIQEVRDTAMEAVKQNKFEKRPRKRRHSSLRYDRRTITLRGRQLTLSCIGKRERVVLDIPEYHREAFETGKFSGGTLSYRGPKKGFFIQLVFEFKTPEIVQSGSVLGIDRGLHHLVVASDGRKFSGNVIRATQRRYLHNRKTLQAKGTPSSRKRLASMAGREKRFSRDVNHCISKNLARTEGVSVFVLEDLSGIRNRKRGRKLNKRIGSWPFFQMQAFLAYKVEALGKSVTFVDPRYTSQRCSRCGYIHEENRKGSRFSCRGCGFRIHADENAAMNIRDLYSSLPSAKATGEQAVVNPPHVAGRPVHEPDDASL